MTANKLTPDQKIHCVIVSALACEAKPVIDFYQLKKHTQKLPFNVFSSGAITVLICGVGQANMAAAINWYIGFSQLTPPVMLINLGVAGHPTADIGQLFSVLKLKTEGQKNSFYPTQWIKHKIAHARLKTVNQAEECFKEDCLYDMEAYAFYQAAVRYVPQEMIQCLKVVSDNQQQTFKADKATVSQLIAKHINTIDEYIQQHVTKLSVLVEDSKVMQLHSQLSQQHHFTISQSHQLKALLQSAISHKVDIDFAQYKNAKAVINALQQNVLKQAVSV